MSDDCFAYTVGGFVTGILLAFGKVLITGSMDYTVLIIGTSTILGFIYYLFDLNQDKSEQGEQNE